jgi:hypothetical protein
MRKVLAVSLLFSCQILWAQTPGGVPRQAVPSDSEVDRRISQAAFEKWALEPDAGAKKAASSKESEAIQEFYSKARHFVQLWQAFARELNEKKTVNAKLAKQISKAFHDLEKSDGWPAGQLK